MEGTRWRLGTTELLGGALAELGRRLPQASVMACGDSSLYCSASVSKRDGILGVKLDTEDFIAKPFEIYAATKLAMARSRSASRPKNSAASEPKAVLRGARRTGGPDAAACRRRDSCRESPFRHAKRTYEAPGQRRRPLGRLDGNPADRQADSGCPADEGCSTTRDRDRASS
jgi:hypothetical protein